MKKIISLLLAAILLTLSVTSCGSGVPKVEEIKPRLTELIEASYEINDIFFGDGLDRVDYEAEYEKIIAEYAEGLAAAEKKLVSAQEAVAKAANEEEKLAADSGETFRGMVQSSVHPFDRLVLPVSGGGLHLVGVRIRSARLPLARKNGRRGVAGGTL